MKSWDPLSVLWYLTGSVIVHISILVYLYIYTDDKEISYENEDVVMLEYMTQKSHLRKLMMRVHLICAVCQFDDFLYEVIVKFYFK